MNKREQLLKDSPFQVFLIGGGISEVLALILFLLGMIFVFTGKEQALWLTFIILSAVFFFVAALFLFVGIGRTDAKERKARALAKEIAEKDEKAAAARSVFLRNMAHDILTPIYGIQGMTDIARDNLRTIDTVNRCLSNISESSDHLLSLVNNVLDVTHLESSKVELKNEPFNLFDVLNSLSGIVQGEIESTAISFRTDFKGIIHSQVQGDSTQLKRALLNFLDNAVKHTPEGKTISFEVTEKTLSETQSAYRFEVKTAGDSLSTSLLTALNSNGSSSGLESAEGSELSLRIARDLFTQMGGHTEARNVGEGGFAVTVEIPFTRIEAAKTSHVSAYTPNLSNHRVLLVEDNAINQAIALYLLKPTQADIALAKNGQEAVEKFLASKEGSFSLILMDISMPIMDGYEATKRIRGSGRKDALTTPILAMTANAFSEDSDKIFKTGMNEHLTKPIDKNMLYVALNTYKDGIPAKAPSKLQK